MVTQLITWYDGGRDKITISYTEGSLNQTLTITSDSNTTGQLRSKTITVRTRGDGGRAITRYINVIQSADNQSDVDS